MLSPLPALMITHYPASPITLQFILLCKFNFRTIIPSDEQQRDRDQYQPGVDGEGDHRGDKQDKDCYGGQNIVLRQLLHVILSCYGGTLIMPAFKIQW
jgi:hypothetical protein